MTKIFKNPNKQTKKPKHPTSNRPHTSSSVTQRRWCTTCYVSFTLEDWLVIVLPHVAWMRWHKTDFFTRARMLLYQVITDKHNNKWSRSTIKHQKSCKLVRFKKQFKWAVVLDTKSAKDWYFPTYLLQENRTSSLNFPRKGGSSCCDFIVGVPFTGCFNKPSHTAFHQVARLNALGPDCSCKRSQTCTDHKDLVMACLWPFTDLCYWKLYRYLSTAHFSPSETSYSGAPIEKKKNTKQRAILPNLKELHLPYERFRWKITGAKYF